MQLISSLCLPNEAGGMQGILSLKGKDLIYGKRTNRYGWIGVAHKLTENGALVVFRNGVEQAYSIDTFVQTFCPAHWSKNQGFRTESLALAVNRVSMNPQPPKQQEMSISELGEYYVWRIGGDIPKRVHHTLDEAVAEASRLAQAHPRCCFKVLHAAATIVSQPITTYDTQVVIH
uniref:Uncharacterized protein n=1 Tax=Pseudomonas phage Ulina01 TaxID=3138549 RepID=A0AAU6VZK9_9CAUD